MSDQQQASCTVCGASDHIDQFHRDPVTGLISGPIASEQPSGLPQSELGGLHPELRARITATTASVADFDRENDAWINAQSDVRPDYSMWAMRLAGDLRGLLETIGQLS